MASCPEPPSAESESAPAPGTAAGAAAAGEEAAVGAALRLAGQLHSLAAVSETLTYRLLDLEERLQAQELRLSGLAAAAREQVGAPQAAAISARLEETEQRLGEIETLLAGLEPAAAPRSRQPSGSITPLPALRRHGGRPPSLARDAAITGEADLQDPFYEEGEQPFMDERPA